jgi:hypothetical protein
MYGGYRFGPLEQCNRGFESHSRHVWLSVLSCTLQVDEPTKEECEMSKWFTISDFTLIGTSHSWQLKKRPRVDSWVSIALTRKWKMIGWHSNLARMWRKAMVVCWICLEEVRKMTKTLVSKVGLPAEIRKGTSRIRNRVGNHWTAPSVS